MEPLFGAGFVLPGLTPTETPRRTARVRYRRGPRYAQMNRSLPLTGVRIAICDLIDWTAPNGDSFLVALEVPCPECGYPLVLPAKPGVVQFEDDSLTVALAIACPAHWAEANAEGLRTGRTLRCGWEGTIREGAFHRSTCPAGARYGADPTECVCGGLLSDAEAEAVI